ncbi:hypothetical protein T492DRAFT_886559 [Pavlovales sp. CCMP2436]|nr:hypothetical protein T492DRAFT_886559 [Pavlovales sp. CCMP2436]
MYALMGVNPMEATARIKKQLIDTIVTIAARGHAQLLLASLSALFCERVLSAANLVLNDGDACLSSKTMEMLVLRVNRKLMEYMRKTLAASLGLPDIELWRRVGLEWRRDTSGLRTVEHRHQATSERASECGGGERRAWCATSPFEFGVPGASSAGGLPQFAWKAGCYIELPLADLPPSIDLAHEYTDFLREQLGFSTMALRSFLSDGVPFFRVGLLAAWLSGDGADGFADAGLESPTQIYLPVWHDNPEMMTGRADWKSPSASLRRSPCTDTQLLCTGAQHLRPKIGMLTACCFSSEDGTLACTVVRGAIGAVRGTYIQKEMTTRQVQLRSGSHAFVRCVGERFLRVAVASAPFGKASGHALLAGEGPVLFAGELEVDGDGLTRWNNMSGTYRPSADDADRALLPLDKLWRVVSEIDVFEHSALDSGLNAQPGVQTQRVSERLLLVCDPEWRPSLSKPPPFDRSPRLFDVQMWHDYAG